MKIGFMLPELLRMPRAHTDITTLPVAHPKLQLLPVAWDRLGAPLLARTIPRAARPKLFLARPIMAYEPILATHIREHRDELEAALPAWFSRSAVRSYFDDFAGGVRTGNTTAGRLITACSPLAVTALIQES